MRPATGTRITLTTLLLVAGFAHPACTVENPDYLETGQPGGGSAAPARLDGAGPGTPRACSSNAQCKGAACPKGARRGCTCAAVPGGKACVPACSAASDCPGPGSHIRCVGGLCRPAKP